ncbi:MAG: lipopolysaccharide assembly protein LapB [Endozoicomonas sp.]
MPDVALLALILVAILAGYFLGFKDRKRRNRSAPEQPLSREYFVGLNYLLNEQTDEAIETFIKALDLNNDTVDTYLALGTLFCRRGEVDKSIRVHQDLLARPSLTDSQSVRVQLELAKDYMSAGLYDRAEAMLAELSRQNHDYRIEALRELLKIYEYEKDWGRAVEVAEQLRRFTGEIYGPVLAHLYCEQAELCLSHNDRTGARKFIRQAFSRDRNCVRASLILAGMESAEGNTREAIKVLERISRQDIRYVPLSLPLLEEAYARLGNNRGLGAYLARCLNERPGTAIILSMTRMLIYSHGEDYAQGYLANQLRKSPSLRGLNELMKLQLRNPTVESLTSISLLKDVTDNMLETKPVYKCSACGFSGREMHWLCPGCHTWGAVAPVQGIEGE